MTWSEIGAALVIGVAGSILASDPVISLNNLAHCNARLALRLIVADGRSAYENIFFSDLAAFESHTIRFLRSFSFYIAAIKYDLIYKFSLVKLEMSLPCCFIECGRSSWVGGIDQWEKDALDSLDEPLFRALAALSPAHSNLLQAKIDRIKNSASEFKNFQKIEKNSERENSFRRKLFEHEKACLARANINIYMTKPFPAWAPANERLRSLERFERRDSFQKSLLRLDYEGFWEEALLEKDRANRHFITAYVISKTNTIVTSSRHFLEKLHHTLVSNYSPEIIRKRILTILLDVKEPKPMVERTLSDKDEYMKEMLRDLASLL